MPVTFPQRRDLLFGGEAPHQSKRLTYRKGSCQDAHLKSRIMVRKRVSDDTLIPGTQLVFSLLRSL